MFLGKTVLKICSLFTGEHPCRSTFSIKLLCNFIENAIRHGRSPVNLLHIFRTPFLKNTSGWLLLCWSILKTFVNVTKIPVIPPLLENNKLITDFKLKANLFNDFLNQQCTALNNARSVHENYKF